ncbi:MAG: hypothetical protein NZM37_13240, partial [Sandaracinaceae bacterium]|nr:hypothetical protein [Sandaracinaceae bacterium]
CQNRTIEAKNAFEKGEAIFKKIGDPREQLARLELARLKIIEGRIDEADCILSSLCGRFKNEKERGELFYLQALCLKAKGKDAMSLAHEALESARRAKDEEQLLNPIVLCPEILCDQDEMAVHPPCSSALSPSIASPKNAYQSGARLPGIPGRSERT